MNESLVEPDRLISPAGKEEEQQAELRLRPGRLKEYIGQSRIREQLGLAIEAARRRGDALDHVLVFGPPGLGKTTLAHVIANEMNVNLRGTSGPVLEKAADLAGLLTSLEEGDVLFIDEIHRLSPVIEEFLYPALEDFQIDIMLDSGPAARSVRLNLPPFTLVGATTRAGLLTSPLRDRFGLVQRLEFYEHAELAAIVSRSAKLLGIPVENAGAAEIARRSRGTPRVANRLLRRVRDYAEVKADGRITDDIAVAALTLLEVDAAGLDYMDRQLLEALLQVFEGGPVGLESLAAKLGEAAGTLEDVYEPYLIQQGYIARTPRGRVATRRAWAQFGLEPPGALPGEQGGSGRLF